MPHGKCNRRLSHTPEVMGVQSVCSLMRMNLPVLRPRVAGVPLLPGAVHSPPTVRRLVRRDFGYLLPQAQATGSAREEGERFLSRERDKKRRHSLRSRVQGSAPCNPVVPGRKQRGTVTIQHSAGVGLEPWPEPAEQVGLGCTGSSLPSALSPTAGTPTQSCSASPQPSAAGRAVQCQGVQHLAVVLGVLSHPCVTEVVLSTLQLACLHAVHTPLQVQQHLVVGQQQGLWQPGISQDSGRDAKSQWRQRVLQRPVQSPSISYRRELWRKVT